MKKRFLLLVLMILPLMTSAGAVTIDGIYYNLITEGNVAEVTGVQDKNIPFITIPESVMYNNVDYRVTSIGRAAFHVCSGLTSVTIPNSVTSIGEYAFSGCWGLTSITIPNSVTSIGNGAFLSCSGLTSVIIPNSVTSIGPAAFGGCSSLTSISVEKSNPIFDSRNDCNAIIETGSNTLISGCKNTIIPNSVTSIGGDAFNACSGLTSVTIPNSVTSIGEWAFYGCSGLTSVTIGNSVTSIEGHAFSGCSGLTSVTIPNSVTSIGKEAFSGCSGLTSVTIPNSVTSIGEWAFRGCSGLTSISVEESNPIFDSRNDCNAIIETESNTLISGCKNTIIPNSVTRIGDNAFAGCGLTSVTIPNSVTSIGDNAFLGCSGLTSVTIPNSVTSIGDYAFYNCSHLTSVTIGNCVTSIGKRAFVGCSGLTSVTIPNSVTSIGKEAFDGCSGLTSVNISDIAAWCKIAFSDNPLRYAHHLYLNGEEIKDLVIPNSVTRIGNDAFSGCSGLTSVTIPSRVTSIGYGAFSGCSGLTSVTIPSRVTSIGYGAFSGCSGLTSVTIPNSVTSIGPAAFGGCSSLTSISVEKSNPIFDSRNDCNAIIITRSNTLISGCKNTIIPNSVTSIGDDAFSGCSGLTSITSLNPTPPSIGYSTFFNLYTATLNVPTGSKAAYQTAAYWSNFVNIKEIDVTEVQDIHVDNHQNAIVYDLNGRKLVAPTKGVSIINGRKVMRK